MSRAATALPATIDNMNHGGRIAVLGLPTAGFDIDWGKLVTHMLTIKCIYGREMFDTWNAMGAMLQISIVLRNSIGRVIADVLPARDWERGSAAADAAGTGTIILDWTQL